MAGGVQAGRLNIEIVAEIARLQQDLDKAKRAVKAASGDIAKSARYANDNIGGMGRSSKLAGYQLQNLGYQLNDIVIGLKGGQKPMTVFMQQGSQIAQIMAQAGIGVGGLAKEVAGMGLRFAAAHPVLLAVAAAAGVIAGGLALVTAEINKTSDVTVTWQDVLLGAFDVVKAEASEKVTAAFDAMGLDIGEVWDFIVDATRKAINIIIGLSTVVPRTIAATYDKIGPAIGDAFYSAANLAIKALNMLAQASTAPLNFIIDGMNTAFGTTIPHVVVGSIQAIENPYAGAMAKLASAGSAALTESFTKDYIGGIAGALYDAAQKRARSHDAAEKSGKELGKAAGSAAGKQFKMSFEEAFKDISDYAKQIEAAMGDMQGVDKRLKDLAQEEKLLGLVGKAREDMLRSLQREAELSEVQVKLTAAKRAENIALADVYQDIIDKLHEVYAAEDKIDQFNEGMDRGAEAAAHLNDQLSDMIGLLNRIGGAGGVLGSLLAIMGGHFNEIASGPVGDLLVSILKTPTGNTIERDGQHFAELLGDKLKEIFGSNGLFGQTLLQTLSSAGLGFAASSAIMGRQGTGGAVGSAVGGLIGGGLASSFMGSYAGVALQAAVSNALGGAIGSALGSAVPVIGTILGGLAGSALGGLFSGAKYGNYSSVSGLGGNNSGARDAAGQLGESLQSGLKSIADALGVTLGAYQTSIGVTDGKYRISTSGRSGELKSKYSDVQVFGTGDAAAAAAVKAAIADAIRDGALKGLSEMDKALLMKGPDIQAQLQKVLAFEGVFKELKATSSPLADELRAMSDQVAQLTAIFHEAGATAGQYAQLQELIAIKQKALIDQASSSYRANFYTDAQNVAYAKQTISDTLSPFGYGNLKSVSAYTKLVEATDALANPELYGALMDVADEFKVIKDAAEAAAQAKAAAKAQKQAEAEAQLSAARDALRVAWQNDSAALRETIDAASRAADTLRDFRDSLIGVEGTQGDVNRLLAKFISVASMANAGDLTAAGQIPNAGKDYLDALKLNARTLTDYQRGVALVTRYTAGAIDASLDQKTEAELQLAAMEDQVSKLIDIDNGVLSVEQAIERLTALTHPAAASSVNDAAQARNDRIAKLLERMHERLGDGAEYQEASMRLLDRLDRRWENISPDGISIRIATDGVPIETQAAT